MSNKKAAPSRPIFRKADPRDLEDLLLLEEACFTSDRFDRRRMRYHLHNPNALFRIMKLNGALIGYGTVLCRSNSPRAWLYSIALLQTYRGFGLGRLLLTHLENVTRKAGKKIMRLEVRRDNHVGQKLYAATGYQRVGEIEDYYEDGCEAVSFEKHLTRNGG